MAKNGINFVWYDVSLNNPLACNARASIRVHLWQKVDALVKVTLALFASLPAD
jgi:hypothetical protein